MGDWGKGTRRGFPLPSHGVETRRVRLRTGDYWPHGAGPAGQGSLEYTITGLTGGTPYIVQMWGMNVWGTGEWSESVSGLTTPAVPPGDPTGLTAAVSEDGAKVELSWTAPIFTGGAPITGCRIESSTDGNDPWTEVFTTTGDGTTYTGEGTDANGPMFASGNWPPLPGGGGQHGGHWPFLRTQVCRRGDPLVAWYDANANDMIAREERS